MNNQNPNNANQWNVENYEDRVKDYRTELRRNNQEATAEGWFERVKENVSDAWEDTKDAASNAWEKTKDWADDAWETTKDKAEDVKSEIRKSTN